MNDTRKNTQAGRTSRRRSSERPSDRERRRTARSDRQSKRSIGADALAAPAARAIGLAGSRNTRPHGRGETARKVEEARTKRGVEARPAVYTKEEPKLTLRERIASVDLSSSWIPIALFAVVTLAICVAIIYGPACAYYAAWRDANRLEVSYEVVKSQNAELNHEVDRLQSREGIEDEARRRGFVHRDEEPLVTDVEIKDDSTDPGKVNEALAAYEEQQPWYIHTLDGLFGYKYDTE